MYSNINDFTLNSHFYYNQFCQSQFYLKSIVTMLVQTQVNAEKLNTGEVVRAVKKRVGTKSSRGQYLALVLLEALVKNCDKAFFEVAAERVLDEMVKLIDDPQSVGNSRNKALMMVEAWGKATTELRYLPVYEETYKVLLILSIIVSQ